MQNGNTTNNSNKGIKYPMDVFSTQTKDRTLAVASHLTVAKTADGQSPLKVYHQKFSVYQVSILEGDAPKGQKSVKYNLNISEIEDIVWRTRYAFNKYMDRKFNPVQKAVEDKPSTQAYAYRFPDGPSAGKTAVEELTSGNGKTALNDQYKWAKEHGDAAGLEAIKEASKLLQEGKLVGNAPYTVTLMAGKDVTGGSMKGKTPAALLLENPDNKARLETQCQWLQGNLEKYPRNKEQIDAIKGAILLFESGKLSPSAQTTASSLIRIYPPDTATPKPDQYHPREDGKCPVRECTINWNLEKKNPVEIEIANYYTDIIKLEDGRLNIAGKRQDEIKKTMNLNENAWLNLLRSIRTDMQNFEIFNARATREDALRTERQNITQALN